MDSIAPALFVIGLLLMAGEILVPGGIIGSIGAIAFFVASVDIWINYGAFWGLVSMVGCLCVGLILFFIEVKMLRCGPLARWFYLSQTTPPTPSKSAENVKNGTKGTAATRLNPTGLVLIDGKRLEAISRDGLIEEGTAVVVVNDDPFRLVVKKS